MQLRSFYVSGRNGTYGDELAAAGLADLLSALTDGGEVKIARHGEGFALTLTQLLDTDTMQVDASPYAYIHFDKPVDPSAAGAGGKVRKDATNRPPPPINISYQDERAREKVYAAYRAALKKPAKGKGAGASVAVAASDSENAPTPPRSDLGVFKALNSMRKGSTSYQDIWYAWMDLPSDERRALLKARLVRMAGDLGDDVVLDEPAAAGLMKVVRALQFYDPLVGKGAGRPKPSGATPASYDSGRVDWFEELLKYRGMHVAMAAYSTGKGGSDTRALVLSPNDVPVNILREVRDELLQAPIFGNLQSEIKAVITITRALIRRSDALNPGGSGPVVRFARRPPSQVIAGLNTAYFLSLGSAAAVMNTSFVGLPGWFPIDSEDDAKAWLELLREFERTLYPTLREDRSESVPILQSLLTCLSAGSLPAALEFFGRYATVQLQAGQSPPRFSTTLLERIFGPMASSGGPLQPIVESVGFKAVARAIRQATVSEMFFKSRDQQEYDIHYGLAQEWRRKARVPHDFVNALTTFLSEIEYETARKQEQKKDQKYRRRSRPTSEELQEVVGLIDRYGSELVCGLLLAFGFAREPRDPNAPVAPSGQPDDAPDDNEPEGA